MNGQTHPRNPAQERRRFEREEQERGLLSMGVGHFSALFEDEGWQDELEDYCSKVPGCPDPEDDERFFAFMEEVERQLIPKLLGAIVEDWIRNEKRALDKSKNEPKGSAKETVEGSRPSSLISSVREGTFG